jgi:hypothetical protein
MGKPAHLRIVLLLAAFCFELVALETLTTVTMTLLQNLSQQTVIFK